VSVFFLSYSVSLFPGLFLFIYLPTMYGSSIYSSTRPIIQRLEDSLYFDQIPRKRGDVIFNSKLICVGWHCDLCNREFDDGRLWRDHHLINGPHKGQGLKIYQSSDRSSSTLSNKQISRLRVELIRKIKDEKALSAIGHSDKTRLHLYNL
jgi:hypothetical protein